jgi:hypothetical protein
MVNEWQNNWEPKLPIVEFTLNQRKHSSTQYSPFYLDYGRDPLDIPELIPQSENQTAKDWIKTLETVWAQATKNISKAAEKMKKYYNKKKTPSLDFTPGELVLLDLTNVMTKQPSQKLDWKRAGPFPVLKKVGPAGYKVGIPETWKIHDVFNEKLLKKWRKPATDKQEALIPPTPIVVDEHVEYEVEAIRDHRGRGKNLRYLVK